jgi:hypothetical protein
LIYENVQNITWLQDANLAGKVINWNNSWVSAATSAGIINVEVDFVYWSATELSSSSTCDVWYFDTTSGYAWALRDGDVGAIPEPRSVAILALGLLGLIRVRRQYR